jgi:hypothetical protein
MMFKDPQNYDYVKTKHVQLFMQSESNWGR